MSFITINKQNYYHNLAFIERFISRERIILVLKDNAYGHGLEQIASLAQEWGIQKVAVKNTQEALHIKDKFAKILILSPHLNDLSTQDNFIYAINDIDNIQKLPQGSKVALKIDTGMHRNGVMIDMLGLALEQIKSQNLVLCDAFSHFHTPSSASFFAQKTAFLQAKNLISSHGFSPRYHIHASGGFLSESKCFSSDEFFVSNDDFDVRIGLLQYGYAPHLKEVLSLHAHKLSSRIIQKGASVGYNATFVAKEDIKISCYDIGYSDGFFRLDGSRDFYLPNGNKILGTMSMDSFSTIDCGDSVCVFDKASYVAEFFGTIEYEILVKLSPNIKRYII